jgi:uncharacterized glyoxalase superfamily protein PhnB
MPAEPSADPQVIPYLLYADAGAAVDWLVSTFGFSCRARHIRPDGTVRHAELVLDRGGVIMLGSPGAGYLPPARMAGTTHLIRITVTDLHGHRERSGPGVGASAIEPGPPGWISYSVTDPEGHQWYFTEQVDP